MPKVSLTDFIDFTFKTGEPRLNHVRRIKKRGEYSPAFDFWKKLRDGIVAYHQAGTQDPRELNRVLADLSDPKKLNRYPDAVKAYKRFARKTSASWFDPPRTTWSHSGLDVIVNPELGLENANDRKVLKLYFKNERISPRKAGTSLVLMRSALDEDGSSNTTFGILDVSAASVVDATNVSPEIIVLLKSEAEAFVSIWNGLPD